MKNYFKCLSLEKRLGNTGLRVCIVSGCRPWFMTPVSLVFMCSIVYSGSSEQISGNASYLRPGFRAPRNLPASQFLHLHCTNARTAGGPQWQSDPASSERQVLESKQTTRDVLFLEEIL